MQPKNIFCVLTELTLRRHGKQTNLSFCHFFPYVFISTLVSSLICQSSIAALSALVNAMHAEEMVALVRRVYNARSAPKLAVLVPSLKRDPETQEESTILVILFLNQSELRKITSFRNTLIERWQIK